MENTAIPLPEDLFQVAWRHAERANLTRQVFSAVPDPQIKQVNKQAGWLLARALGEADALQRAIGNWIQDSPPSSKAINDILAALRKGPRGPAWWRRLTGPWRAMLIRQWHADLAAELQRTSFMKNEVKDVQEAVIATQRGLDAWNRWAEASLPEEVLDGWGLRYRVLSGSMEMLSQRLTLRRKVGAEHIRTLSQAISLVDTVRHAKGVGMDQAWEKASRLAEKGLSGGRG